MCDSGTKIQEGKENITADDKSILKERLKKTIADELSKLDEIECLIYKSKANKEIKVETCIYRVPDKLRKVKEDAYRPSVVSIGPFHAEDPDLAPMIRFKRSYMLSFVDQCAKDAENSDEDVYEDARADQDPDEAAAADQDPDEAAAADQDPDEAAAEDSAKKCLEDCINAVAGLDVGIRHCYTENIKYNADKLVEMMLLDGCFILELFLRSDKDLNYMTRQDYYDPFLSSAWTTAAVQHDLVLLENQIPYFVLELLYDAIKPHLKINKDKLPDSVASLALKFFKPLSQKETKKVGTEFKHLLDLLLKFYFHPTAHLSIDIDENPGNRHIDANPENKLIDENAENRHHSCPQTECKPGPQSVPAVTRKWEFKYCASDLMQSGIEFQAIESKTEKSLLELTFNNKGLILIPQLHIHETANSLLRNLIAFEQCSLQSMQSVTSYVFLLKRLIATTADGKLLVDKKIVKDNNPTGQDDYFTQLDSLLDKVTLKDDFYFDALFHQVDNYCKSGCNLRRLRVLMRVKVQKQVGILRDIYFSSMWKVISLIVAFALLFLTSLQTYFTIYPVK